jgi:hypothetical protein
MLLNTVHGLFNGYCAILYIKFNGYSSILSTAIETEKLSKIQSVWLNIIHKIFDGFCTVLPQATGLILLNNIHRMFNGY